MDAAGLEELPDGWCWTNLDTLTYHTVDYRGKTPPQANEGIPIISSANVKSGKINQDKPRFVSLETYRNWTTRGMPQPGDLVITTEAPVGEVALFPEDGTYLLTRRVIAFQTAEVDNQYIAYCFECGSVQAHIDRHLRGSTVPRILKPDLLNSPIPLPPLEEQAQILSVCSKALGSVLKLLVGLTSTESSLTQLDQSILSKAFRGELVPQDPRDEPASELLDRIREQREEAEAEKNVEKKTCKKAKITKAAGSARNARIASVKAKV